MGREGMSIRDYMMVSKRLSGMMDSEVSEEEDDRAIDKVSSEQSAAESTVSRATQRMPMRIERQTDIRISFLSFSS